jgi:multiple sugar transport system permease protein
VGAVLLSFTFLKPGTFSLSWVGFVNYRAIFNFSGPENLGVDFTNTYVFVGLSLAIETVLGIVVALLLAKQVRGIGLFRTIYALPLLVASVGAAVAWSALLNRANGWVDYFLGLVGLGQPVWLADPKTAMLSVVIADSWSGIPVVAFIVLAGLLSLPTDPVEASRVDGASSLQTLRYITLPALRPVIAFAVLYRMLGLFQQFVLFQVMTGGGPVRATQTFSQLLYSSVGTPGFDGAMAVVLVLMMVPALCILLPLAAPRRARGRRFPKLRVPSLRLPTSRRNDVEAQMFSQRGRLRRLGARTARARRATGNWLSVSALAIGTAFILLPLLWIVVTAFQSPATAFQLPPRFIFTPTPSNFSALYSGQESVVVPYLQDIGHSLIVLISSGALALGLGVPAGYSLARSRFRGSRVITSGLIALFIAPAILYVIPLYFIYTRLDVAYAYPSLVLFYETFELPIVIFLMRSYFADVPPDFEDSARTDGCTRWQAFHRVVLPMVRPGLVTVALLVAISSWGEFFGATILTTTSTQTAPVAIFTYVSFGTANWSVLAAATLVLVTPVLFLTIFLLRGFAQRFTTVQIA